jgi:hypothetical protein
MPAIQYKQFLKRTKTEPSATETPRKRKTTLPMTQYKALLKRMKTEPIKKSDVGVRETGKGMRGFNAGQWIDEHFDFFPAAPPRRGQISRKPVPGTTINQPVAMVETPQTPPVEPEATITQAATASRGIPRYKTFLITKKEAWITAPRSAPKLPLNFKHRTKKVSKSLQRGWDRVIISTSSIIPKTGIASETPGASKSGVTQRDIGVGVEGVRAVTPAEERMSLGSDGSLGSRSETFHTEGEIIEAEEVVVEVLRVQEVPVQRAASPVMIMEVGDKGRDVVGKEEHGKEEVTGGVEGSGQGDLGGEIKVE